jgi:hypothetical protein
VERVRRQTFTSSYGRMPGANQARSGGLPFVAVVQTADFGSAHDAAGRLDGAFHWSILAEREVRARPLVVRDVGPKDSTKMPLIEDDDVVQTLAADRADDAFDVGIGMTSRLHRSGAVSHKPFASRILCVANR